jgi:hypothetical protein
MTRLLSRFRTGDLVEVRGKEEILATLDEQGRVDGMPFMPEMFRYCGRQFRVSAVAHKTCDTVSRTWQGRRLRATVHLAGVRCDGSAHGGCQAECNLFWKDVWLKPVAVEGSGAATPPAPGKTSAGCTEERLAAGTRHADLGGEAEPRYACQATTLLEATEPLAWWDPRQYALDVLTGNRSPFRVARVLWLASLRWLLARVPFGYRLVQASSDRMHRWLTGRPSPSLNGKFARGSRTPTAELDLRPGEYVRIKSKEEIEQTVDEDGNNRGLGFDQGDMAPYCGGVYKVHSRVSKIIDEATGRMRHMKQPCIILEGVTCNSEYASCRLNCPRAIYSYWREIWLERVPPPSPTGPASEGACGSGATSGGTNALRLPLPQIPAAPADRPALANTP